MSNHYSDYQKKNVPVSSLEFDKIGSGDKELLGRVRKSLIRMNRSFLVLMLIAFAGATALFIYMLLTPADVLIFKIIALAVISIGVFATGYQLFDILVGGYSGILKGVVLAASRIQELKDNRNYTYQYVFDIYIEEKDQTLMSYAVNREVFSKVEPGDGVVLVKRGNKVKVLEDVDRKCVFDVSNIKSGV